MRFTRFQLALLTAGIIAAAGGAFVWILNLQQDFIADDAGRLTVEHISGNYTYAPISKLESLRDFSTGNNNLYTADGKIRVNINSSDIVELSRLPGVGPATARRFIEYRMMNGPFTGLDELTKIRGIGSRTVEKIRDIAYIGAPEPISPEMIRELTEPASAEISGRETVTMENAPCGPGRININTASSEQLQTLPRVGPAIAARIINDRETNGPFNEIGELTRVKGIGPKTLERMKDLICAE